MVKISDIKITEHSYEQQFKQPDADTKKCLELISAKDLLALLPSTIKYTLRFTLSQANSQLANAIRRCLMNELPTYSMTFNLFTDEKDQPIDSIKDLSTNDKHIFGKCEVLKKRIEAIPIRQDIHPEEWTISIDVKNETTDLMDITANHFKIQYNGKIVPSSQLINPHYLLIRIYPKCFLKINNIYIKQGIGQVNANLFRHINNIYYEIDEPPMNEASTIYDQPIQKTGAASKTKSTKSAQNNVGRNTHSDAQNSDSKNIYGGATQSGQSSMMSNYSKFIIGYSTYRNHMKATDPIKSACTNLINRLNQIKNEWVKLKDMYQSDNHKIGHSQSIASDKLQVIKTSDFYTIHIEGEYHTLINAIYYYVYAEMPDIEFATGGIIHFNSLGGHITIKHQNYAKIFDNALAALISDLQTIHKAF